MPRIHLRPTIGALLAVVLVLVACSEPEPGGGTEPDGGTDLTALLEELRPEDHPGMVAVVGDRHEAELVATGVADLDTGRPLRVEDRFRIASSSKPMVAAALLTYVDAGELGLEERIADHLPAEVVDGLANADQATLRQLLQMTSGIPEYLDSDAFWATVEQDPSVFFTPREVLAFAEGLPADHPPGLGFTYSNSNYVLAQLILEELSGQPLAQVLDEAVFEPAGMTGCSVETAETFAADMVRGHDLDVFGELVDVTEINDGVGLGDGGVVCGVGSLVRFLPALLDGAILDEGTLAAMLDGVDDGSGSTYGLGIDVDPHGEFGLTVGHDGGSSGFQSVLLYLPDEELSVAVLSNSLASDLPGDLADDLLDWWYDED